MKVEVGLLKHHEIQKFRAGYSVARREPIHQIQVNREWSAGFLPVGGGSVESRRRLEDVSLSVGYRLHVLNDVRHENVVDDGDSLNYL